MSIDNRYAYTMNVLGALEHRRVGSLDAHHFVEAYSSLVEKNFRAHVPAFETARTIIRSAMPSYAEHYAIENPLSLPTGPLAPEEQRVLDAFASRGEIGAPSALIAKWLKTSTANVSRIAKRLAARGLLTDTGLAARYERGLIQYTDRLKTEGGMLSKPGASTVWVVTEYKENPIDHFELYVVQIADQLTDVYDVHPDDAIELIDFYQDSVFAWLSRGVTVDDAAHTLRLHFDEMRSKYA